MTNIKERVLQISDYYGVKKEKFFAELGLSYANFKGIQKNTSLSSDAIDKIISFYPDISIEWLIIGKGAIIKTTEVEEKVQTDKHVPGRIDIYLELIDMQKKEIARLEKELMSYKKKSTSEVDLEHAAKPKS